MDIEAGSVNFFDFNCANYRNKFTENIYLKALTPLVLKHVYITDVILYCRSTFNLSYRKDKL